MKQRRIGKGILVLVMAVAMLMGILPIAAMADSGIITSFDEPETAINVTSGTAELEMLAMLPASLTATVNGASTAVAVAWEIDPQGLPYNGNADGVYTYRAVISSGYTYAGATPTAVVTVGAGAGLLMPMSLGTTPVITLTDKVVVIDEATATGGQSGQTGYSSLELAMKAIGTSSGAYTVVFVGTASSATLAATDRTAVTENGANADITFTSKYYASEAAAASDTATTRTITLGTIVAGAKSTTFKDIETDGTVNLYANCKPLTIDTGVVNNGTGNIYGGKNADMTGDTNVTVNSGNWGTVQGGNTGSYALSGNINVTVGGDATVTTLNGGGSNSAYTSAAVKVNGNANVTKITGAANSSTTTPIDLPVTITLGGTATVGTVSTGTNVADGTNERNIIVESGSNVSATGVLTSSYALEFQANSGLSTVSNITTKDLRVLGGGATLGITGGTPLIKVTNEATFASKLNVAVDYDAAGYSDRYENRDYGEVNTIFSFTGADKLAQAANAYANITDVNRQWVFEGYNVYRGIAYFDESVIRYHGLASDENLDLSLKALSSSPTSTSQGIFVGGYADHDSATQPTDVTDLRQLFYKKADFQKVGSGSGYSFGQLQAKIPGFSGYFITAGIPDSGRDLTKVGYSFNNYHSAVSLTPTVTMTFATTPGSDMKYKPVLSYVDVVLKSADGSKLTFVKRVNYLNNNNVIIQEGYLATTFTILPGSKVMTIDWEYKNTTTSNWTPRMAYGNDTAFAGGDWSYSISDGTDIGYAFQSADEPLMYCWNDDQRSYGALVGSYLGTIYSNVSQNKSNDGKNITNTTKTYDTAMALQWDRTSVPAGGTLSGSGGIAFGDPASLQFTDKSVAFLNPAHEDAAKTVSYGVKSFLSAAQTVTGSMWQHEYSVINDDGSTGAATAGLPAGVTLDMPASIVIPANGAQQFQATYHADDKVLPGKYRIRHYFTIGATVFAYNDTLTIERNTYTFVPSVVDADNAPVSGALDSFVQRSSVTVDAAKTDAPADTVYKYWDGKLAWTRTDTTKQISGIRVNGVDLTGDALTAALATANSATPYLELPYTANTYMDWPDADGIVTTPTNIPIVFTVEDGPQTASLTVKKTVTAPEGVTAPADEFTFTVSTGSPLAAYASQGYALYGSDDAPITTDAPYATGTDGKFTLKAGQYAVFADIANGTPYQVVETVPGNYTCDKENATVTGTLNANATETFTNTYVPPTLTVNKTVAGKYGSQELDFDFTVTVKQGETAYNGTLTAKNGNGTDLASITLTNGSGTFKLHHGQSIVLSGIPQGATATVSEVEVTPYVTTYKIDTAAEATAYLPAADRENPPAGAAVTMSQPHTVSFTNTNDTPPASGITLRKYVLGAYGDTTKLFTFSITAKDKDGNALSGPLHYKLESDTSETPTLTEITLTNGVGTVELKHGDSIVITDMPSNGKITVTEDKTGVAGYNTMLSVDEGTRSAALDPATTGEVPLDGATSKKFYFYNESNIVPTAVKLGGSGGNTGRMLLLISLLVLLAMTIMMLVMVVKRSYRPARRARH